MGFSLMFPNFHEVSFASGRQNFFFLRLFFYQNLNLLQSRQFMNNLSISLYFSLFLSLSLSFKLYEFLNLYFYKFTRGNFFSPIKKIKVIQFFNSPTFFFSSSFFIIFI